MKVVILAGGFGTRLSEETHAKPKPMVEIGGEPILRHVMKIYSAGGHKEFLIAAGYKAEIIKKYFETKVANVHWDVRPVDTGLNTGTGGRLKRLKSFLNGETFMMTYGDGVSDIDTKELLAFHRKHKKLATVTAVRPPARFGRLELKGSKVVCFQEKSQTAEGWINGGFFVLEPEALDYIQNDNTMFEREPLENLAKDKELVAFKHEGFWQCVDTLRDLKFLNTLWDNGNAPWKVWKNE